jgi:hypothetical protein
MIELGSSKNFSKVVVIFATASTRLGSPFLASALISSGREFHQKVIPFCFHVPDNTLHFYQVNYTLKLVFSTNRQLKGYSLGSQHFFYLLYYIQKISARLSILFTKPYGEHCTDSPGAKRFRSAVPLHPQLKTRRSIHPVLASNAQPHGKIYVTGVSMI